MKKKLYLVLVLLLLSLLFIYFSKTEPDKIKKGQYAKINTQQAKEIMDADVAFVLLDVRELDEYQEGRISGAILVPYTEIENSISLIVSDKEMIILVYCRSGRRSKIAAELLLSLGYSKVYDMGGIVDWPYEIELE